MPIIPPLPGISINGGGGRRGSTIFGGYIYSANYDTRLGDGGGSSVIVNIISESGNYTILPSNLNLSQVYNIAIGANILLPMYLKRYKIQKSPSGKILEVEFTDGSFKLDKFYVGLYKKYGKNLTNGQVRARPYPEGTGAVQFGSQPSCLIIVGREQVPCDRNFDGNVDVQEADPNPCHPCNKDANEIAQANLALVHCKESVKYDILPVNYNFTELKEALALKGFVFDQDDSLPDPNPLYRASYTGPVREVLGNFCSDFGWIFYWENGKIHFKDLRTVINVNATISQFCPNLESLEEEHTLDGTVQTSVITNYTRPGRGKELYTCYDARHYIVQPYTKSWAGNSSFAITDSIDETAAAFCNYSEDLRDIYYWFDYYDVPHNIDSVGPESSLEKLGITFLSSPIRILSQFENGTQLGDVSFGDPFCSPDGGVTAELDGNGGVIPFLEASNLSGELATTQDAIATDENFMACFIALSNKDQWKLAANMLGKYFFFGFDDTELKNQYLAQERDYAREFMGKYHVFIPTDGYFWENITYLRDSVCGGATHKDDGRVTWNAIDMTNASFEYYNNTNPQDPTDKLSNLPFSKFLALLQDANPITGDIPRGFKLVVIRKDGNDWYPGPGAVNPSEDDPIAPINDADLLTRAATYLPKICPYKENALGQDLLNKILTQGTYNDRDTHRIKLFLAGQYIINISVGIGSNANAIPGKQFNGRPENLNDSGDPELSEEIVYRYPNLLCAPIGNQGRGCKHYLMETPVATFEFDGPADVDYGVVVEKTKQVHQKIAKIETIMHTGSCPGNQALAYDVNFVELDDQTINDIKKVSFQHCTWDLNTIQEVHNNFSDNLSLNQSTPLIRKTFTVAGIDINGPPPTIGNGLLGIKVSVDSSGIKTTYEFGTTKMKPPAKPDVYQLGFKSNLNRVISSNAYGMTPLDNSTFGMEL